jgi:TonB-dependent starch-binding outer membrane protein SusC
MRKHLRILSQLVTVLTLMCLGYQDIYAQAPAGITVKGKVIEQSSGQPLPGVTIVEVNENNRQVNGTISDGEGNYSLKVSSTQNKLRFSFISYDNKTEAIGNRQVINVGLSSGAQALNEVSIRARKEEPVQTGFTTIAKRDVIGAITSVSAEALQYQPATSIDQMLQGRAAGVQITNNSGDPGAGTAIRIRGAASLSAGNEPLYVIDGIPIISTPFDDSRAGSYAARSSPIADINPSDIERIDVLKDANATAIYGARASNGVILITTKRGKTGKTTINFNSQFSMQTPPKSIPVLDGNSYKVMRLEAEQNRGIISPTDGVIRPLLDDPSIPAYHYYQFNTDWVKALQQTGYGHNYNLSFNGGGESTRYSFSTSWNDRRGALINTRFNRFTTRFNLDYRVSNKVRFGSNIYFARSKTNNHASYDNQSKSPYNNAHIRSTALPIYDVDAEGNPLPSYAGLPLIHDFMDNPVAAALLVRNDAYSNNLKPNIYGEVDITKGLKYRSNASLDFVGETGIMFLPPDATGELPNNGNFNRLDTRSFERMQLILDNLLTYTRRVGEKHNLVFLAGNTFNKFDNTQLRARGAGTSSDQAQNLGAVASYNSLGSSRGTETIVSLFAKADYIFNDKYGINGTIRRDGSSKFGGNNKYANFPSVGAYWRASSEPFFQNIPKITNLKLRLAWGQNGNSGINNYAYISSYSAGSNYMGEPGVRPANVELDNLRWETSTTTNFGIDLELFESRLVITNEWYMRKTNDLLWNRPVPTSIGTGFSTILQNFGNIRNRGVEFDVNYDMIRGDMAAGELNWNVSFNIGSNDNLVTYLPDNQIVTADTYRSFTSRVAQGDPLGTYYGYRFKGVYAYDTDAVVKDANGETVYELDGKIKRMRYGSETGQILGGGDAIYEDFNHDGIINDLDKVKIGNGNPKFFGGFNNAINYKNFGLNFFIQYQYGNDVINGLRMELENMEFTNNQAVTTLNRWRKQGDVTNMPKAIRDTNRNWQASDRWVEDGSYARLKYITLNYVVPRTISQRFRLSEINTFFTAANLITLTNYTGADPEIGIANGRSPAFIGVDEAYTPQSRSYTLGLNLRF